MKFCISLEIKTTSIAEKINQGIKMEITQSNRFISANRIKQLASEKAKETSHKKRHQLFLGNVSNQGLRTTDKKTANNG